MVAPVFPAQLTYIMEQLQLGVSLLHAVSGLAFLTCQFTSVKTGRWGGVITAFITMSDIKDEIDWEFPGAKTTEAQSNYFWQGIIRGSSCFSSSSLTEWYHAADKTQGQTHTGLSDTFSNYHDYTVS